MRKRTNVEVVRGTTRANKLTSRCQFKGFLILDEDITLVQSCKTKVTLDKPIACGFNVLEYAKHHMGWFWYHILKPKYGEDIKLLLSDTDSFIYAAYTEDGYQDLYDLRSHMDLAGYVEDTPLYPYRDPTNKKVPGKMSDEKPTEIIREVIALKPKMYSVLTQKFSCVQITLVTMHCVDKCFVEHCHSKGCTSCCTKHKREYHMRTI